MRLLSKKDVLLYINEAKVSGCDTHEQCDTSSEDNVCLLLEPLQLKLHITSFECLMFFLFVLLTYLQILAKVDLWPSGLPEGWVKELVYRKNKGRIDHERSGK